MFRLTEGLSKVNKSIDKSIKVFARRGYMKIIKVLAVIMAVLMVVSFAGCQQKDGEENIRTNSNTRANRYTWI